MQITYPALLTNDPVCGLVVTFRDIPEAITHGEDREAALASAEAALGEAIQQYLAEGRDLPDPSLPSDGEELVETEIRAPEPRPSGPARRRPTMRTRRAQPWRRGHQAAVWRLPVLG